jgi:hypothetical protein
MDADVPGLVIARLRAQLATMPVIEQATRKNDRHAADQLDREPAVLHLRHLPRPRAALRCPRCADRAGGARPV